MLVLISVSSFFKFYSNVHVNVNPQVGNTAKILTSSNFECQKPLGGLSFKVRQTLDIYIKYGPYL